MSKIFNPSFNWRKAGYVSTITRLPTAEAAYEFNVIYCGEDKRFYECVHIVNDTEDYFKWVAVTSGAQRTFFIPVEALTDKEFPATEEPSKRTNCFDAIAAALNEIAISFSRYNIRIDPLCYEPCFDTTYKAGKKYYVWHNNYDRADYIVTPDTTPIAGKPYFLESAVLKYETVIFEDGDTFESGKVYFESTRPILILDPAYSEGAPIDHRVFVSNGKQYDKLTKPDLVSKANEIVEIINTTGAKLIMATDDGTLFDLCSVINTIIDEINPFSNSWNHLLGRVDSLERNATRGQSADLPLELPVFVHNVSGTFKLDVVVTGGIPTLKIQSV